MVNLDLPLRPWVPQWLGALTLFLIFIPTAMLNGAYTGSMLEVSSSLGVFSEDISMGYYATSVGMAVAYPVVRKVLDSVPPKSLLLGDLPLQALLSYFCTYSNNIDIIIVCSFFIGLLKAFVMLWCIIHLQPLFSPGNVRSEFYAYFFPLVFAMGQLSMALTAQLAYYYDWRYMYYLMMLGILVLSIRPSACPLPTRGVRLPQHARHLDGDVDASLCLYLRPRPRLVCLVEADHLPLSGPPSRGSLCLETANLGAALRPPSDTPPLEVRPRLPLHVPHPVLQLCEYPSVLSVDSVHTNSLSLYLIPGFAVGGFVCFWWFRWQRWRFRFLIAGGMACYALYFAILYFGVSPASTYEMLYFPMFLRGLGMMILVIAFGVFVVEEIDPKLMLTNAFFVISVRSAFAPVMGVSFYTNALYYLQQRSLTRLSEQLTLADPLAAARYNDTLQQALASGHGMAEAQQLATNTLYNLLQQQSLLLGLKTLLGYLVIATLLLAIVSRFIPFHQTVKVDVVRTGDDMG